MLAIAALGLASGTASADAFVPLPDGETVGPGVTIKRVAESALISPSMAANGAGRVAWVSGTVLADVTETPKGDPKPFVGGNNAPGTNNSSTHGTSRVSTGYIVGCQVSIADNAISAGVSGGLTTTGMNASGSISVQIGPGEVKFVGVEGFDIIEAGQYHLSYKDVEMQIQGCAGYAQARAYTVVEIIGTNYSKTSLYGAPFSIG
ncbi:mspA family protein [Nocardia uniformis]|uniref:MspA family protein n=1 Tax=Nocardia uniformis TaxID=53432 RepID=A0A849C5Z3_9NOCA|nr:MspA family porin [Nocardia uniformis]NNH73198.1 mspA family protein [Nocardia uniformis]